MKKYMHVFALLLCVLLCTVFAVRAEVVDGMTITNGVLTAYTGSATEIVIPSGVTKIGDSAFKGNTTLQKVTLPEGLTEIGRYAFQNCANLEEAVFPSTLELVNKWAFMDTSLRCVDLSYTAVARLENACFSINDLEKICLPDNVEMGHQPFFSKPIVYCKMGSRTAKNLAAADTRCKFMDSAYSTIWLWEYDAQENLMVGGYVGDETVITLPADATAVAPIALWKEANSNPDRQGAITSITVPEGYTSIGDRAFDAWRGCRYLAHISLPSTLKCIGEGAFRECYELSMIQLPDGLESFSEMIWHGGVTTLTIPTTVTSIPDPIVLGSQLTTVVLPAELTQIADMAFGNGLTDVYCYRGSYAEEWAKEQSKTHPLTIHYIKDSTFSGVAISGPGTAPWDMEYYIHDVGTKRAWMEQISVLMEPGTDYKFVCTSSDPAVARVTGSVVEYLKPGKATLTISVEGRDDIIPCVIAKEVYKPVEEFSLPGTIFAKMAQGNNSTFAYAAIEMKPADANPYFMCYDNYNGSTSCGKAEKGSLLVGWSNFETRISNVTVTSWSGITKKIRVVYYNTIGSLEAYAPTRDLIVGETYDPDITLTVDGSPIGDLDIYTITSSNPNVAVGVNGKHVKAMGRGTATITVKEAISGFSTKFVVNVDARDALITPRALQVVGPEAFAGIEAREIILYDECIEIQSRAFAECANLERIEIPTSVKTIAADAFEGCSKEMVIITPSWSEAKRFADANGFKWEDPAQ